MSSYYDSFTIPGRLRSWWRGLRWDFKILICLCLLAVAGGPLGWFVGRPLYRDWRQGQALKLAEQAMARGDKASFRMAIQQFADFPGGTAQDWEAAAEMLEKTESKDADVAWREAVRRAPGNSAYAVRYLSSTMKIGDLASAGAIIEAASEPLRQEKEFPVLAARYYLRVGNPQAAEEQFEHAVGRDPDPRVLLDYGRLLMNSSRPDRRERGLQYLEKASADPEVRLEALRALFVRDLMAKWFYSAGERLEALRKTPGSDFSDEMLLLDLDAAQGRPVAGETLDKLAASALKDSSHLESLAGWLLAKNLLSGTARVLAAIPDNAPAAEALPLLQLRLAASSGDWVKAEKICREELHNPVAAEALLAAMDQHPDRGDVNWRAPIDRASADPVALELLRGYYLSTKQTKEEMPVVQALLDQTPQDQILWNRLFELCRLNGETALLRRFISERATMAGNPPNLVGEIVTLDLLTDRLTPDEALEAARQLRTQSAASPAAANAEAFALARLGRGEEALAIYRQFPEQAWHDAPHSVLVGYAFAQAGNAFSAERRFAYAEQQAEPLLVEYRVLIQRTRDAIAAKAQRTP